MSAIMPVFSRRELIQRLQAGPVNIFVDDRWPFKVLTPVKEDPRFLGVFTEGPQAGICTLISHETGKTTQVTREDDGLTLLYPQRFALSDFVSYAVRAVVASGRDYKKVTMDISRSVYYAGFDCLSAFNQWTSAASSQTIAVLQKQLDWLSSQMVGTHPTDTLQVTLAVFAEPYLP